jgi:hypothetical protein
VREVVLDTDLMHQVVVGVARPGVDDVTKARCEAAARHFRWDGEKLHIRGQDGMEREVVPWGRRKRLVREVAAQLGFPGGKRLYPLLKVRYYWVAMQRDCIAWCTEVEPNQVEQLKFRPPSHL